MVEFSIETLKERFHNGHNVIYFGTFPKLAIDLPPPFVRWPTIRCTVNSTYFMFRLTIQVASSDAGVDCNVFIKRLDDVNIRLDGGLYLTATVPTLNDGVVLGEQVNWYGMPPGAETTRNFTAFIPKDILTQLGDRDVMFQAFLGIEGCHSEKDTVDSPRARHPQQPPEELRLLSKL